MTNMSGTSLIVYTELGFECLDDDQSDKGIVYDHVTMTFLGEYSVDETTFLESNDDDATTMEKWVWFIPESSYNATILRMGKDPRVLRWSSTFHSTERNKING